MKRVNNLRIKPECSFFFFSSQTQAIFLCSHYTRHLIVPTQKGIRYMREQQRHRTETSRSHTRTSCWRRWPGGFCALNPSPHSRMFTSVSVGLILRSYLFTSATTVRIGAYSAPKYGTETIQYVTLRFRYWRFTLFTEVTPKSPFLCVNRSLIRFSRLRESYLV